MSELNNETTDDLRIVTLTLDDDEVIECAELCTFDAGEHSYIALVPLTGDDEDDEESEVYIYRYLVNAEGQPELENIESDEEYDIAADAFDEWCDEMEFEELGDDE